MQWKCTYIKFIDLLEENKHKHDMWKELEHITDVWELVGKKGKLDGPLLLKHHWHANM